MDTPTLVPAITKTSVIVATGSVAMGVIGGIMLGYGIRRYQAEKDKSKEEKIIDVLTASKDDDDEKKPGTSGMTWALIVIGILLIIASFGVPYLKREVITVSE